VNNLKGKRVKVLKKRKVSGNKMEVKYSPDGKCRFYEGKHTYWLGKRQLTNATSLIGKYFKEFDAKGVARMLAKFPANKAKKHGVRYWLDEWKKAREEGTLSHEELEIYVSNAKHGRVLYPVFQPRSRAAIDWYNEWIVNKIDYEPQPELLVYDEELGVAGQIDLPLIHRDGKVIIADYKFTKKIDTKGYKGQKGIHPLTEHLDDCKLIKYGLQLSMYAYLLERQGLSIDSLLLVHVTPDCKVVTYNVPYDKKTIVTLLEDFKNETTKEY